MFCMEMRKVNYINIIISFLISNLHTYPVGLEPMTDDLILHPFLWLEELLVKLELIGLFLFVWCRFLCIQQVWSLTFYVYTIMCHDCKNLDLIFFYSLHVWSSNNGVVSILSLNFQNQVNFIVSQLLRIKLTWFWSWATKLTTNIERPL